MATLEHLAALWWSWMGAMALQASLLIGIVGVIDLAGRRFLWPQVRYALWLLVLLKLLLPPAWSLPTSVVPSLERQVAARVALPWRTAPATMREPRPEGEPASAPAPGPQAGPAAAAPTRAEAGSASPVAAARDASPSWRLWALLVWAAGVLAFATLLAARLAALRRWHDRQRQGQTIPPWYHELLVKVAARLGVGRLPAIVFSDRLLAPAVCGVIHPVMYLPRDYLDNLSPEEAEHVLLHEMAHLKRGDLWLHALGLLVQVVYWFNPLVALARRRTQHVREICTDLAVADVLRERTTAYRATLIGTARRLLTESAAPGLGLLGVFEEPFRLVSRLRWLEKPTWERRRPAQAAALLAAAAMLLFVLPMAGGAPPDVGSRFAAAEGGAGLPAVSAFAGAATAAAGHDLYVRNETRRDDYLLGFKVDSQPQGVGELWIADGRLAQREGPTTIIVDLVDSTLTYVNHADRSYVVTDLPLDLEALMTPELLAWRQARLTTGRVEPTGARDRLLGLPCREFQVVSWEVAAPAATPPVEFTVWASSGAPHDLQPFYEYLACLRLIHGRTPEYTQQLLQMDGLQMRLEREFRKPLVRRCIVDEVVAVELIEAPPEIFAPPEGYLRKDRLSRL